MQIANVREDFILRINFLLGFINYCFIWIYFREVKYRAKYSTFAVNCFLQGSIFQIVFLQTLQVRLSIVGKNRTL